MNDITLVITSCGRENLLTSTIKSFLNFTDIIPDHVVLIENSGRKNMLPILQNITEPFKNVEIIINEENMKVMAIE